MDHSYLRVVLQPLCTSTGSGLPEREGVVTNEGLALAH